MNIIRNLFIVRPGMAATCILLAVLSFINPAFAQLDYDTYDMFQGGNIVGVIYVPQRGPDTSVYAEYWVMSNRYVYPSEKNPVETTIKPTSGYHYTSLTDFLAKVPFGDGFHYVTVVAFDRTSLPRPVIAATAEVSR